MTDIVERLRETAVSVRTTERRICDEAADEIERLREALRRIAEDKPYRDRPDDYRNIAAAALGFEDKWDNE